MAKDAYLDMTQLAASLLKKVCQQDRLPKQGTATNLAIVKLGTQEATFDLCLDLDHLRAMADSDEGNVELGVHVGDKTIRGVRIDGLDLPPDSHHFMSDIIRSP